MCVKLLKYIGRGGMSEVYLGINGEGKSVAVKVMSDKFHDDKFIIYKPFQEDVVFRFKHEATVMSSLSHPGIPKVYDFFSYEGKPAIVMELVKGVSLGQLKWSFDTDELKLLWNKIVHILCYIHNKGVVHSDISPDNIMLNFHNEVKLIDFGVSDSQMNGNHVTVDWTWGTKEFMSPEQILTPKLVDYRTDYYSLARTFVYLLSGNSPTNNGFAKDSGALNDYCTAPDSVFRSDICHCSENLEGCPDEWKLFLTPYLAKDPKQRPQFIMTWGNI